MNRREFLKLGAATALTAATNESRAEEKHNPEEFVGVLVDTTRCIGCRSCERACSVAHELPVPDIDNDGALTSVRDTSGQAVDGRQSFHDLQGRHLREEAVHALLAAGVRRSLFDQRHVQDAGGTRHLAPG